MDFLRRIFGGQGNGESRNQLAETSLEETTLEPKVSNEQIAGTLDLGWYYSENKDEFQMAKIPEKDRGTHFYVIGATGTGKTKFLQFLIQQDIEKGNGLGVIDPHGDLIEDIKGFLTLHYDPGGKEISERVILIDPTDYDFTVTFNPLEKLPNVSIAEQAGELISAFRKIWSDSWGVRMEDLMRNSLIALGESELTLVDLPHFLTHRDFRETVLEKVNHPVTQNYFQRFEAITDRGQITWIEPVMNKINAFLSDGRIRQIFSSSKSTFNLREIMDQKKMLLIKLDKGKLKDAADLLGSLLMAKIQMAAFSRSDIPQNKRTPFYLYIDEFQNFATESFSVILSEARKYGLSLIMAHQTLAQIATELRSLILGNTGIQVYFRVNRHDAQLLAKEAFEYSGYEVKTMDLYHGPKFWTLGEEWEHYTEALQNLAPRVCFAKHKIEGGIIPFRTVEIEPVLEFLGMEEDAYQEYLQRFSFGKKYLVPRQELVTRLSERDRLVREGYQAVPKKLAKAALKPAPRPKEEPAAAGAVPEDSLPGRVNSQGKELSAEERVFLEFVSGHPGMFVTQIYKEFQLSGYKGDKLKEGLIEKGLISQEETREGKGGRLAKILTLTDKGASILKASLGGKGGDLHKQLQVMLKEQAELYGWKAKIEEKILGSLETVDVGLRKDEVRVAIEISSTTKADQEIQNIRKCLEAGYDYIVCVSGEEKSLASLKAEARKSFTVRERERMRFSLPGRAKELLQGASPTAIVSENGVVSGQISRRKQLLDTNEAADLLGISKNTLYEWVVQRKIPYVKVGRLTKFKTEDLEAWIKRRTQEEDKRTFPD